jgi:RNA polymerase sigma-70 factor, ECF subfamily
VLYAKSKAPPPEQEWVTLVQSIAKGDQLALHALYERTHRPVFTLVMRITANRETAEELTVDVFHEVWRRAARYEPANGTVLGWIMNQARSRAIDRLRFESRKKRSPGDDKQALAEVAADPRDVLELREQAQSLSTALAALTPDERQAIEMTFFLGLPTPKPQDVSINLSAPSRRVSVQHCTAAEYARGGSGEAMSTLYKNPF